MKRFIFFLFLPLMALGQIPMDYEALPNFYSEDGKIFPNKSDIISGREANV